MANLLGQNIGTNYKGILNLNTLNGNLSATLQAVTDGDGNASLLQLSTTQVNVGGGTALGRLVVRGDGTNPIARFEDSTGTRMFLINNAQLEFGSSAIFGSIAFPTSTALTPDANGLALAFRSQNTLAGTTDRFDFSFIGGNVANTAGTASHFHLSRTFAAAAGSANFRPLNIAYTINNSGAQTGTATGIFLNATETALNGMTHNLMDLQVGGVSRIKGTNSGELTTQSQYVVNNLRVGGTLYFGNFKSNITFNGDNNLLLKNAAETSFGLLQFGGTTSAFPALKRSGTTLQVRVADDTNFADIEASIFATGGGRFSSNTLYVSNAGGLHLGYGGGGGDLNLYPNSGTTRGASLSTSGMIIGSGTINASAVLQADSTTTGFLPPRMTTAQKTAITSPAKGLVVYDTDTDKLCVYNGAWTDLH